MPVLFDITILCTVFMKPDFTRLALDHHGCNVGFITLGHTNGDDF